MAAPIKIAGAKTFGREKWVWVPAIADKNNPSTAEVTAASGLDISCYLFDEDSSSVTQSQNRGRAPRRVCDTSQAESLGIIEYTGGTLVFAVDPQAAAASDGKKAWETLVEGAEGFLVRRFGIDVQTDFAEGQFVDVVPAVLGRPSIGDPVGDAEFAEVAAMVEFAVPDDPAYIVELAA